MTALHDFCRLPLPSHGCAFCRPFIAPSFRFSRSKAPHWLAFNATPDHFDLRSQAVVSIGQCPTTHRRRNTHWQSVRVEKPDAAKSPQSKLGSIKNTAKVVLLCIQLLLAAPLLSCHAYRSLVIECAFSLAYRHNRHVLCWRGPFVPYTICAEFI